MQTGTNQFELTYNSAIITVEKTGGDGNDSYTVRFSNEVPELLLIAAYGSDGRVVWDTVPPGNTILAEAIGALITKYEQEHPGEEE